MQNVMIGDRRLPPREDIDYTKLTGPQLIEACGIEGAKWARALSQHMRAGRLDLDEATLAGWFANAIVHAQDEEHRKRMNDMDALLPAEAVYGVLAWLTTSPVTIKLGAHEDAGIAAEAAGDFCKANNLGGPRPEWCRGEVNWKYPGEEDPT